MSEELVQEERQRGWIRRNWWWFFPLAACLGVVVVLGLGMHLVHEAKRSVPYNMALELVQADDTVRGRLGEPIEATWRPPDGEQSVLGTGAGTAERRFDVVGPKGRARVKVVAICEQWSWTLDKVQVKIAGDRKTIDIKLPPEGDPRRTREAVLRKNIVDPY